MFTLSSNSVRVNHLMSFLGEERGFMKLRYNAMLCRSARHVNIYTPIGSFTEISSLVTCSLTIRWKSRLVISVSQQNWSLMEREREPFVVLLTTLLLKFWKVNKATHMKLISGLSVSSFIPLSLVNHHSKLTMSRPRTEELE